MVCSCLERLYFRRQDFEYVFSEAGFWICVFGGRILNMWSDKYWWGMHRWPVQVWCMKQGTQSQCSGTTQRDGAGREEGRGFQDGGTHVHPWLIHVNVWQKPPQFCKSNYSPIKLIKKNFKKENYSLPETEKCKLALSQGPDTRYFLDFIEVKRWISQEETLKRFPQCKVHFSATFVVWCDGIKEVGAVSWSQPREVKGGPFITKASSACIQAPDIPVD